MGRPTTLLEGLCGHARLLGAQSIEVEHKDGREWVIANKEVIGIAIANYPSSGADAKELRESLYASAKRPVRTVIGGQIYILQVGVFESLGEDAFVDPSVAPRFTAKQGQYLAFIYNYSKIHRQSPAESDLERHFGVFPARGSRNDQDAGAQRSHRKDPRAG